MKITLTYHDVHKFRRIDQIPLNTISIILIETIGFEPMTHPLHNDYTRNHHSSDQHNNRFLSYLITKQVELTEQPTAHNPILLLIFSHLLTYTYPKKNCSYLDA